MEEPRPKGMSIGAVTQLTGIAADTIRTWERRYAVVVPLRDDAERRVYSEEQVQRLRTISALADRGERVADLARLTDEDLAARLRLHATPAGDAADSAGPLRAVVVHPLFGTDLDGTIDGLNSRLRVVAHARSPADAPSVSGSVDVLLVDLTGLGPDPHSALRQMEARLAPRCVVVTHGFLARPARERLSRPGVRLIQSPISTSALRRTMVEHGLLHRSPPRSPSASDAPEPLPLLPAFTTDGLQALVDSTPSLACECPNHIAAIVLQLRSFEAYSRGCENNAPADARLHAELAEGTARAAHAMERLLRRVLEHEGLSA